ncbi:MAG: L-threonylcarbamoyladenylate synthase [Acidimicrobiales bacterium]
MIPRSVLSFAPPRHAGDVVAAELVRCLLGGGVALVPTETVYGLVAHPGSGEATQQLFRLKGRPENRRLPVAVASLAQMEEVGAVVTAETRTLMQKHWPGPLTLVVGLDPGRTPPWMERRDEAAFRCPDNQILLDVLELTGPLLLTSANAHGDAPSATVDEALAGLRGRPEHVVDGGPLPGVASTVLNLNVARPAVERAGPIIPELG